MILAFLLPLVRAENKNVCVDLFYGSSCPHCHEEIEFLSELEQKYPKLKVNLFEVHNSKENAKLYVEIGNKLDISPALYNSKTVPVAFIGDKAFVGFDYGDTELYNKGYRAYIGYSGFIEKTIQECLESGCVCASESCDPNGECPNSFNYLLLVPIGIIIFIVGFILYKFGIKFKVRV